VLTDIRALADQFLIAFPNINSIEQGKVEVDHLGTAYQLANIITKAWGM